MQLNKRKSNISLRLFSKTHYKSRPCGTPHLKVKNLSSASEGVFSTQLGEINSLAFMTESSFIGFCLKNKSNTRSKMRVWVLEGCAAAKWQIEGYVCDKQRTAHSGTSIYHSSVSLVSFFLWLHHLLFEYPWWESSIPLHYKEALLDQDVVTVEAVGVQGAHCHVQKSSFR